MLHLEISLTLQLNVRSKSKNVYRNYGTFNTAVYFIFNKIVCAFYNKTANIYL